ncbi:MAG: hypothetical protein FWC75_00440 [Oscillospiraceae bacterium]|nr:hypothetical protein [Oscillospiraceae bacterium]
MVRCSVTDPNALRHAVDKYFSEFPGEIICALQLWYEGLGGQGVPTADELTAIQDAIAATPGWKDAGEVRYEKFGVQKSYKCEAMKTHDSKGRIMIQHTFKRDALYKEPNGTILKLVTTELWNLRCFEIKNGKMTGGMIKIHPESDRAKALVEVKS